MWVSFCKQGKLYKNNYLHKNIDYSILSDLLAILSKHDVFIVGYICQTGID